MYIDEKPLIELEGITKSYSLWKRDMQVLKGVSLVLERSCFASISGPSGCGKSTLLNIMGCLDVPASGTYRFDGETVDPRDENAVTLLRRERFGFIFQAFNLLPVLTAVENVEIGLAVTSIPRDQVRRVALEMLDRVGLADHATHRPSQLSGGQQQRVAIARALAKTPDVIFADEPTANLDEENTGRIVELMSELNADDGVAFVIATHDPAVYEATRSVYRIRAGEILESVFA